MFVAVAYRAFPFHTILILPLDISDSLGFILEFAFEK